MVFEHEEDSRIMKNIGINVGILVGVTLALIVLSMALGQVF